MVTLLLTLALHASAAAYHSNPGEHDVDRPLPESSIVHSMAAADLDGDGIKDLVLGLVTPSGPLLGVRLGNPGSLFPNHPGMTGPEKPFSEEVRWAPISVRPDFLSTGDFNGDGRQQVAMAARGGHVAAIAGLPGASSILVRIPGPVRDLQSGELGLPDGIDELVFATDNGVYASTSHGLTHLVDQAADHIALTHFRNGSSNDLALASGTDLILLETETGARRIVTFESPITGLVAGAYGPEAEARIVVAGGSELAIVDPINASVEAAQMSPSPGGTLSALRRSGGRGEDLLVGGVLIPFDQLPRSIESSDRGEPVSSGAHIPLTSDPIRASVALRLNPDALDDVVLATRDGINVQLTAPSATFTVNDAGTDGDGDTTDGICDTGPDGDGNLTGVCTLGAAVMQANASGGSNAINFAIPGSGPFVLSVGSVSFSGPVTIDGSTQPGFSGQPLIVLTDTGLNLEGGNSVVRNVLINVTDTGFRTPVGIQMTEVGNNTIEGVWMGLDAAGAISDPDGVPASGDELGASFNMWIRTPSNTIGGSAEAARNVVVGAYDGDGILIAGPNATGNVVEGNYIGLDPSGEESRGNTLRGVSISNAASANTVRNNVIAGNSVGLQPFPPEIGAGVALQSSSQLIVAGGTDPVDQPPVGNLVVGNLIGTNSSGSSALGNARGVMVDHAQDNTIGGSTPALRNVISGNLLEGVYVIGNWGPTTGNILQGNYIGTDATGALALPNVREGVRLSDAGTTSIIDNVVSGNSGRGIAIERASDVTVTGNLIGVAAGGASALGNVSSGIQVASSTTVQIGASGSGNVIGANAGGGIFISGSSSGVTMHANAIGTDALGVVDLGNGFDGIRILGNSGHSVGGTNPGEGNTIAYNAMNGIGIWNGTGYAIRGNSIFSNDSLGIDLGIDGVTLNDEGDGDTGQNNLQNFPSLGFLDSERVRVTFEGQASTGYTLEFFANATCDPSDYGEGKRFLEAEQVTTDSSGEVEYIRTFSLQPNEDFLTATATDAQGNTSEFSRCSDDLRLIVNTVGDAPDADTSDPVCDTGLTVLRGTEEEPECTLRAAIQQANANDDGDEITFDIIEGSAPHTITPGTSYDFAVDDLLIDGTTAAGYGTGAPAIVVDGNDAVNFGLRLDAGGSKEVRGLSLRRLGVGIYTRTADVTLHDMEFRDNLRTGMEVVTTTDGTIRSSGPLVVTGNGFGDSGCDTNRGGLELDDSDLTAEMVVTTGNCGAGLLFPGGQLTVTESLLAEDNGSWGIRVNRVRLLGQDHAFRRNGDGGIGAFTERTGFLEATGSLTVEDNGTRSNGECESSANSAITTAFADVQAVRIANNCGNGIHTYEGAVNVAGDVVILSNEEHGVLASGGATFSGGSTQIQSNGNSGVRATNGAIAVSGESEIQFNGRSEEGSCDAGRYSGLDASAGIMLENAVVVGNCGFGILASGDVRVTGTLRVSENGANGVSGSGGLTVEGESLIASRNGGHGARVTGTLDFSGALIADRNTQAGLVAQSLQLSGATGTACHNGQHGLAVLGGSLELGAVVVCSNGIAGIYGAAEGSGKQASASTIVGATIVANGGDGILLEAGESMSITSSSIFGNAGLAVNNTSTSASVTADGNWWGSSAGPGSAIAGMVTVSSVLSAPPASDDADGDGVSDAVENLGSGDANQDGTADADQAHVASLPSVTDGRTLVLVSVESSPLSDARSVAAPVEASVHPSGYVDARISMDAGTSTQVTLHLPSAAYVNFTAFSAQNIGGVEMLYSFPGAVVEDSVITLTVTDGALGDADLEVNGSFHLVGGGSIAEPTATRGDELPFSAHVEAYPTPFTRWTTIEYSSPGPGGRLEVVDMLGRVVAAVPNLQAGHNRVPLDGGDWAGGLYFVVLSTEQGRVVTPILRVR